MPVEAGANGARREHRGVYFGDSYRNMDCTVDGDSRRAGAAPGRCIAQRVLHGDANGGRTAAATFLQCHPAPVRTWTSDLPVKHAGIPMEFEFSPKVKDLQKRLTAFMEEHIYPSEAKYKEHCDGPDRWQPVPVIEELKPKARAAG